MHSWVVSRPVRQRGGGKVANDGREPPPELQPGDRVIGAKSILRYVEALSRLWDRQQRSSPKNEAGHPRDGPITAIIDTAKRSTAQKRRDNYDDKLVGTYVDGLTSPHLLRNMAVHGLLRNTPEGLRDRAMVLLSHYGML